MTKLGVNIDHVATVRQARKEFEPDPVAVALAAVEAGAEGITAHLREDRRHIQDSDILRLKEALTVPLNMEMAISDDVIRVAERARPAWCCVVPEQREELTTEGGLSVLGPQPALTAAVGRLKQAGIKVSLFVEADAAVVRASKALGADAVEFHTGAYAYSVASAEKEAVRRQLERLRAAALEAKKFSLLANAGHGLTYDNVTELVRIFPFNELNIGFSIVGHSFLVGIRQAVAEMKSKIESGLCAES